MSEYVLYVGVNWWSKRSNGPKNPRCIHCTSHNNLIVMQWDVYWHWEPATLRSWLSAETKRIFAAKQKECGIRFSIVCSMRLLIHKVRSRFATWVAEFLNHACLMWIRMHQFCCILWPWSWNAVPCSSRTKNSRGDFSNLVPFLSNLFSAHFLFLFSYCSRM